MKSNFAAVNLAFATAIFAGWVAVPAQAVWAAPPDGGSGESGASALHARHEQLKERLAGSPYKRPLVLESSESADTVDGSVDAVLQSPYSSVSSTFKSPGHWCDVMILHLNTKYCHPSSEATPGKLTVHIGKKTAQELKDAFELNFDLKVLSATPDYLAVTLTSPNGPMGTTDYRMEIQAIPLNSATTFLRLRYSYGYGAASRMAMRGYLATIGSGKVGFTPSNTDGSSQFVGGMRGAVERNTMRYYLAIEAFQAALTRPAPEQLDARLVHWFDATEEFPRQLREVKKADYLAMKKAEIQRQKSASRSGG
jgi:hypothetical protein